MSLLVPRKSALSPNPSTLTQSSDTPRPEQTEKSHSLRFPISPEAIMTKRIHPKVLQSRLENLLGQQALISESVSSDPDQVSDTKTLRLQPRSLFEGEDPFETLNNFEVLRIMSGDELRSQQAPQFQKVAGNSNSLVEERRHSAFRRVSSSSISSSEFDDSLAPSSGYYSDYSQHTLYQNQLYYCSWEDENQRQLKEDREQDALYYSYYK